MASYRSTDETLTLWNRLEAGAHAARAGASWVSPYKLALALNDVAAVVVGLWLGVWVVGLGPAVTGDPAQAASLIIVSLVLLAFSADYHLYNHHVIFSPGAHLKGLSKSLAWSMSSVFLMALLFNWPSAFEGGVPVWVGLGFCAVLTLLSRFFWEQSFKIAKSLAMSFVGLGAIGLLCGKSGPIFLSHPDEATLSLAFAALVLVASRGLLIHVVFNTWMRRHFRRQVVIVGSDEEARNITAHVIRHNAPFWIAGVLSDSPMCEVAKGISKDRIGCVEELPAVARKHTIDELVVTDENIDRLTLIRLLDYCISAGITVWFPPKLLPIIDIKLDIDQFCGLPAIRLCSQQHGWLFSKIKYGVDALISLPAFMLLAPIFLVVAAAIKLDSPGPVFYLARVVGKSGRLFTMYKFRSMKVDNDPSIHKEYVTKLIKGEIGKDGDDGEVLKIQDDPRVTRVGALLRKLSLDELPQLINVLKGDMSLVGPRPCLPYEYELYKDWHKKRLSVRPGITGLWQVAGRSAVTFEEMVVLDLYYIYNRSVLMDMSIISETIFAVLQKRGAY